MTIDSKTLELCPACLGRMRSMPIEKLEGYKVGEINDSKCNRCNYTHETFDRPGLVEAIARNLANLTPVQLYEVYYRTRI